MHRQRTQSEPKVVVDRLSGWLYDRRLKVMLVAGDATAIAVAFTIALVFRGYADRQGLERAVIAVTAAVVAGIWAMRSQDLYLARVSMVRVVEITRTARAVTLLTALVLLSDRIAHDGLFVRNALLAGGLTFIGLCIARSVFRSRLGAARARGEHRRRVVIVGTDEETVRLMNLFSTHAELGIEVVGVVGDRHEAVSRDLREHWLGEIDRAEALISFLDVSGVVVSPATMAPNRLNELIRNLHAAGRHVQLSTGVAGIDSRRLRSLPMAYEPLVYVEAPSLRRTQLVAKRCFDVVVASIALVIFSPLIALVAVAIRLDDGGPILFRQNRVGKLGQGFDLLKLRSMSVDAEQQLSGLVATNERSGPLFKMSSDPRVTRIGRLLRDSSIDELPQLINVLRGEMSLVGPRPALQSEVENFPDGLRVRESVLPGISGLWQVEARDNPSFEAYRRLDLFYVENWSMTLDLIIVLGTIEQSISRLIRTLFRGPKPLIEVTPAEVDLN